MSATNGRGWKSVTVGGQPADLYLPSTAHPLGFVLLYLHGVHLGRLVGQAGFEQQFEHYGLPVFAPMAGPCWWADRHCPDFAGDLTPEQFVLGPVLQEIQQRFDAPAIGLLGTSMGGQGALRLSFKHPRLFPAVAAISPAIDYHRVFQQYAMLPSMYEDAEQARQETATLYVNPLNPPPHIWFSCDPTDEAWFESSDRLQMKLAAVGVQHTADLTTSAGGHSWAYYNHMAAPAVTFLVEGLQQRRHRLPLGGSA